MQPEDKNPVEKPISIEVREKFKGLVNLATEKLVAVSDDLKDE